MYNIKGLLLLLLLLLLFIIMAFSFLPETIFPSR